MDNKSSSGYDGLSNKIIKTIKNEISKPLTLIINQMITSGIFPDDLKIAKIIPLYKKGDIHSITNYRPISLLPTLSKIFERVIFIQLYTYFDDNNILMITIFYPNNNMDFEQIILQSWQLLNWLTP